MTDQELKEFNDFVQENPVRNNYLPILEHISKLKPVKYSTEEFGDKDGNTTSIQVYIQTDKDIDIVGRVGYDTMPGSDRNNVIYELWWDEECYCLCHGNIQMRNMLTLLVKKAGLPWYGFSGYDGLNKFRRSETLMPIPE